MLFAQSFQDELSVKAFRPTTDTTEGANAAFSIGSRTPSKPNIQYSRPNSNTFKLLSIHMQHVKILKAVSKWRAPDNSSLPASPTSSTNIVSLKAVHKHDQSTESGRHTSTRAFFESLTKPTHEDTVLPPTHNTLSRKSFQHQTFR